MTQRRYSEEGRAKLSAARIGKPKPGAVVAPVIERDGVPGKACVTCLVWKPLDRFSRSKCHAHGRRNLCTTCEGRVARERHPERLRATVTKYQKAHPDRVKVVRDARRDRLKVGPGVTAKQWREIREAYDGLCAYCGQPATTIDHVVPLSRGGKHDPANVVPACAPCNYRKHNRLPEEWKRPRPPKEKTP